MASKSSATLDDLDLPDWFFNAVEELKPTRPRWCKSPPAVALHSQGELPPESYPWMLAAMRYLETEAVRHDLFDLLKRHADANSLDTWMAAILQSWIDAGAPPRDGWVLASSGYLGRDATVRCLRDAVRQWTKEKQRSFAVQGVDALGRIGTKLALDEIATLAAGLRDHGVADDAHGLIERKGTAQGISREEMEDRHVSTCGLDSKGERQLNYGPRYFRAVFGKDLQLVLLDQDGKPRKSLPPPAATDDPLLAPTTRDAWGEMKTEVKRVLKAQQKRLEQAMITGRSWTWPDFQQSILGHPIVSRLARFVVWQTIGDDSQTLRVTEDLTMANARDESVSLGETHQLRVAHPLRMPADEVNLWTTLFADYGMVQPFSQLTRTIHRCEADQLSQTHLPVPPHEPLESGVLYGVLDNDCWRLGRPDGGIFRYSWKSFIAEKVTAAIFYSGLIVGSVGKSPLQKLRHCAFYSGVLSPEDKDLPGKPLTLGEVPPVPFTETMRRLLRLTAAKI